MKEENMHESDAQWTPAYESIAEFVRNEERRQNRWASTLLWIDLTVATTVLGYLVYVLLTN